MRTLNKLFLTISLIIAFTLSGFSYTRYSGYCEQGGQKVTSAGVSSTTYVQRSYPSCTVTVNTHGSTAADIYSDNTGTVLANPFTASSDGSWSFYAAEGHYDIVMSGGGITGSITLWDIVLTDQNSLWVNIKSAPYNARGDSIADDTAAIQAAVNATAQYGTLVIPSGNYRVTDSVTFTKPINVIGMGESSVIYVDPTVPNTTDIFVIDPSAEFHYFTFKDFTIRLLGALAGRHAISIQGKIQDSVFEGLRLYGLNGSAIYGTTTDLEGTPILTRIDRCVLVGGIDLAKAGDTIWIRDNHITSTATSVQYGLIFNQVSGASTIIFQGNSVTSDGGIQFQGRSVFTVIRDNELEALHAGATGSDGAYLNISGAGGLGVAYEPIIEDNTFQMVNGATVNCIRLDFAYRAKISGNRFSKGLGTYDIDITANALNTEIAVDNKYPDTGIASINDSGVGTNHGNNIYAQQFSIGATTVDTEQLRFGRDQDGLRYNSIFSKSDDSGVATMSFKIHDGSTTTSQSTLLRLWGLADGGKYAIEFPSSLPVFADNAAAVAGGLDPGFLYRTGGDPDTICIVH